MAPGPVTPLERLFSLERFGVKLGLDNIRAILDALGHPERAWRAVHIAGTNGKGSVAAMVERGLRAGGWRTGRYTSPHLHAIEERVAIDGRAIDAGTFAAVTADVLAVTDLARRTGALTVPPTFFEVSTAIAFEIFRRARVDAAVVEVGLGGRFDATNVLAPEVSAITSIAFDHERHLGHTLAAIAFEKAGIVRRGVPVVVGRLPEEAKTTVERVAAQQGAPVVHAHDGVSAAEANDRGRITLALRTPDRTYPPLRVALLGRHQAANAVVAVRILEAWSARVRPLSAEAIATGLTDCDWPGRLEWLQLPDGGRVLIDAAHNPAGAAALADYLRDAGVGPLPIVLAAMQDKDVRGIVSALAPLASIVVATTVPNARARSAEALAAAIVERSPETAVEVEASPDAALAHALAAAPRVVVAGSIFLIGPLRARLLEMGATRAERSG